MILVVDEKHDSENEHKDTPEINEKVDLEPKQIDNKSIVEQSAISTIEDNVTTINESDLNNDDLGKYFKHLVDT